jgi:hypothetical protein
MDTVFGLIGLAGFVILWFCAQYVNGGSLKSEFYVAAAALAVLELAMVIFFFNYLPVIDYIFWIIFVVGFTVAAYRATQAKEARAIELQRQEARRRAEAETQRRDQYARAAELQRAEEIRRRNEAQRQEAERQARAEAERLRRQHAATTPPRPQVVLPVTPIQQQIRPPWLHGEFLQNAMRAIRSLTKISNVSEEGNCILVYTRKILGHKRSFPERAYVIGRIKIVFPKDLRNVFDFDFWNCSGVYGGMIAPHIHRDHGPCWNTHKDTIDGLIEYARDNRDPGIFREIFSQIISFLEIAEEDDNFGDRITAFPSATQEEIRAYARLGA